MKNKNNSGMFKLFKIADETQIRLDDLQCQVNTLKKVCVGLVVLIVASVFV